MEEEQLEVPPLEEQIEEQMPLEIMNTVEQLQNDDLLNQYEVMINRLDIIILLLLFTITVYLITVLRRTRA